MDFFDSVFSWLGDVGNSIGGLFGSADTSNLYWDDILGGFAGPVTSGIVGDGGGLLGGLGGLLKPLIGAGASLLGAGGSSTKTSIPRLMQFDTNRGATQAMGDAVGPKPLQSTDPRVVWQEWLANMREFSRLRTNIDATQH